MSGPNQILIAWDPEDAPTNVSVASEGETLLRRLHTQLLEGPAPVLAVVERPRESTSVSIGLGGQCSMLSWLRNDDPPEDLVSLGRPDQVDEYVRFLYAGVESEFPASVLISFDDAMSAVREYMETGARPTHIRWQEV